MPQTSTGTRFILKDDSVEYAGTEVQEAILNAAGRVYAATHQPLVVTAANDGEHMEGSLHYDDKALDLRVWDLRDHEEAAERIQALLGEEFDVIAEWRAQNGEEVPSHIHAEHDPSSEGTS